MLHEGTASVNAENILLFNENTLSKCKFVLSIRKSEELKYSSIVLLKSLETDRGYQLVSYRRFVALSPTTTRNDGRTMGKWLTK